MVILMEKQVFVFVHIPKCFGTSFLDSIEHNNIERSSKFNKRIKWIDVFHNHYLYKYHPALYPIIPVMDDEVKFIEEVIPLFLDSKFQTLLLHVHADTIGLDKIIPENIYRRYIVTMREPKERLISAYKYKTQKYGGYASLFSYLVYKNGLERIIPRIFGLPENYLVAKHHMEKLILLELDDYVKKSHVTRYIEDQIGIKIEYNHSNQSDSRIVLPPVSDLDFWLEMNRKAAMETRYYNYLMENNFNDMFLSY